MKKALALITLFFLSNITVIAQGFNAPSASWPLPAGGYVYSTHNYGFNSIFGDGGNPANSQGWTTIDINGDHKPDLVVTSEGTGTYRDCFGAGTGNQYWKVYLNNGNSFSSSATTWSLPAGGYFYNGHTYGYNETFGPGSNGLNSNGWSTIDMNADGKPDLVVTSQGTGTDRDCFGAGTSNQLWKVYLNTGSGFSATAINWTLPTGGYTNNGHINGFNETNGFGTYVLNNNGWYTTDINGDGKPDLVITSIGDGAFKNCPGSPGTTSQYWQVYLNNGNGFTTTALNWTLPAGGYIYSNHTHGFFDYYGIGSFTLNSMGWSTIDMNGDSKPDLVVSSLGDGTHKNCPGTVATSNQYWIVYFNNGTGFSSSSINWTLPAGGFINSSYNYGFFATSEIGSNDLNSLGWNTADLDADGKPDLVISSIGTGSNKDCLGTAGTANQYWKIYKNNGNGFAATSTNWTLPAGGYINSSHNYGFNSMFADGGNVLNTLGWSTLDLNGDNAMDLILTSQGTGTYRDCFDAGTSNQHWNVYLSNLTYTSLEEIKSNVEGVNVFPNPFENNFTVNTTDAFSGDKYSILNLQGRIISEGIISSNPMIIDLSAFADGMYFIQIAEKKNTIKIVKQ